MRKHPRQEMEAELDALLKEPAAEEVPRADGWAAVQPLWRRQLYLIGRGKHMQDADIQDMIEEVFAAILPRWEDHRQLGAGGLLALSRKMMHDKVVDEIRRRDRQRACRWRPCPPSRPRAGRARATPRRTRRSGTNGRRRGWMS